MEDPVPFVCWMRYVPVNCHYMQCKNISDTTQGPTNIPTTYATCSGKDYVTCTIGKYDNVKINIEKGV